MPSPSVALSSGSIAGKFEFVYFHFTSVNEAAGTQAVDRSFVAALAFLTWDILITFDDEVELIWPRAWSSMKGLYFFVRYVPLSAQLPLLLVGTELSPHFHFTPYACYVWQIFQGVVASSIVVAVDIILILRVCALYHRQRTIRGGVFFLFLLEIVGMVVGLALSLPGIQFDDICAVTFIPHSLVIYGLASILFQTILFALTMYKFVQGAKNGWGDIPIVKLLIRDGTWAFFLLFFADVSQLSLYALPNRSSGEVLYPWLLSLSSFCGYRVLLNLRRYADDVNDPEAKLPDSQTTPSLHFKTRTSRGDRYTVSFLSAHSMASTPSLDSQDC
ncbi:hypothetical protein GALMADRAFT_249108 [Galerina marginata CBS 339.88]|uniref:DUF6533 domain-containing protein n=1 Tax=Galerina marginata (strain CBS 339.88) TaxID=685588 RepID=A0A067SW88_GALM3|nr:hypothetical protein GALMADRAFT_249108 [Galerina marginata CBS 339.88]